MIDDCQEEGDSPQQLCHSTMDALLTKFSHVQGDVAQDEVQAVKGAAAVEINKMRKSLMLEIAEME